MKINKKIRLKIVKRIYERLKKELRDCNPYGYVDCDKIYEKLDYWEDLLIKQQNDK